MFIRKRTARCTEDEGRNDQVRAADRTPHGHTLSVFSSLVFFSYPLVSRIHAVVHRRFNPLINIARTGTREAMHPAAFFFGFFLYHARWIVARITNEIDRRESESKRAPARSNNLATSI